MIYHALGLSAETLFIETETQYHIFFSERKFINEKYKYTNYIKQLPALPPKPLFIIMRDRTEVNPNRMDVRKYKND